LNDLLQFDLLLLLLLWWWLLWLLWLLLLLLELWRLPCEPTGLDLWLRTICTSKGRLLLHLLLRRHSCPPSVCFHLEGSSSLETTTRVHSSIYRQPTAIVRHIQRPRRSAAIVARNSRILTACLKHRIPSICLPVSTLPLLLLLLRPLLDICICNANFTISKGPGSNLVQPSPLRLLPRLELRLLLLLRLL
jgi:hypothetical protein